MRAFNQHFCASKSSPTATESSLAQDREETDGSSSERNGNRVETESFFFFQPWRRRDVRAWRAPLTYRAHQGTNPHTSLSHPVRPIHCLAPRHFPPTTLRQRAPAASPNPKETPFAILLPCRIFYQVKLAAGMCWGEFFRLVKKKHRTTTCSLPCTNVKPCLYKWCFVVGS